MAEHKKQNNKSLKQMEEHGLLLRWLESSVGGVNKISLGRWLEKGHPNHLDYYLIFWFIVLILFIVWQAFTSLNGPWVTVVTAVLSYRLLEIAVNTFDSVFIMVMMGKRHRSIPRLFSLILANYVQVIWAFGLLFDLLMSQTSLSTAFYDSAALATLAGTSFDNPSTGLLVISIFEMLLGVLFIAGAIAAVANYLGNKE